MKILAIGGCGSMGRYAIRAAQNYSAIKEIIIADINKESAETFAASLNQKVSAIQLDANDTSALKQAMENIDIVMLMQIPSISSNIATSLIEKYNSMQNLINTLRENENILQNFKINERKISKNVVENLKKYLHI